MGEICCGSSNSEGDGVTLRVENVRGVRLWRVDEVRGEGEEVLESEGKRVFENG